MLTSDVLTDKSQPADLHLNANLFTAFPPERFFQRFTMMLTTTWKHIPPALRVGKLNRK